MVALNFSSFMLVMVLFIFLTIKGSIAHSDDQATQTLLVHEAENGYSVAPSMEKDVLDDVEGAVEYTKGKMGGRKMLIETKNVKEKMEEVEVTEEADSKNSSGNSNSPSNRPLGDSPKNVHHQTQGDESKKSAKHNLKNSSDKLVPRDDQSDDDESFKKLDSEKLREDATEFFTMMNKDYIGGPGSGSKPHHKPPINNFQISHKSNP